MRDEGGGQKEVEIEEEISAGCRQRRNVSSLFSPVS